MKAVYHKGSRVVPEEFARQDPASVPAVIAAWVKALQGLEQAQHTQQALLDLLNIRPGHTQPKSAQVGAGELVPAVRHLVEYERSSLAAADTIAAAEGVVAADPSLLLHRIVAQFQHLFDCPRLQGVLPALNQRACWNQAALINAQDIVCSAELLELTLRTGPLAGMGKLWTCMMTTSQTLSGKARRMQLLGPTPRQMVTGHK
ncbi:hypothetical protein ABBQ38_001261 [Trebouxia sp. C0009 RCD-2024]